MSDHYDPQDTSQEAIDDALRPKFEPDHDLQLVNLSLSWSDFEELRDKWDAYIGNKEITWDSDDIPPADVDLWENAVHDMDAMIERGPTSGQLDARQIDVIIAKRDEMRQRIDTDLKTMPQNNRIGRPEPHGRDEEEDLT